MLNSFLATTWGHFQVHHGRGMPFCLWEGLPFQLCHECWDQKWQWLRIFKVREKVETAKGATMALNETYWFDILFELILKAWHSVIYCKVTKKHKNFKTKERLLERVCKLASNIISFTISVFQCAFKSDSYNISIYF